MQRTALEERPRTQRRGAYEQRKHTAHATHTGHFERKQHAHWRDAGHNVQATSSTCDYNVYDYHNQHARGYADGKYDVYTKYSGDAPGAAGAWQQPQHQSAYGRYACYNQSQWTKHDAGAWLPGLVQEHGQDNKHNEHPASGGQCTRHDAGAWLSGLVQEHGQDNVRNEHSASGGQWTRHDAGAWLQTLLTEYEKHKAKDKQPASGGHDAKHNAGAWLPCLVQEYGQDNVRNEQPAPGGQWTKHDAGAWLPGLVQEDGQDNVGNEQAAYGGQCTKHDDSAWLQTLLTEDCKHKAKDDEVALGSLRYTQDVHNGVKRLIDTVGDGGKADEQHRSAKMRKLYDPGNIKPLDDYDVDDWGME